ncbi:beta-propeller domain-containing protein [Planotetraspora sp. A-T 1434]|uniref:beta-propeller domain-containing protein n=1 Tax=Planotetraspora sp. A-T 1434 TaxID=2979219 RepID=UPI0021BDFD28|nr:beta-propeller domain-containing protein [Planotetraspora sp. A-T 1434]MCT9928671.1 beta-propeller domain-containing protein [Planotetraspora sp. A-T 1434]
MRTSIRTAGTLALAGILAAACSAGRAAQAPGDGGGGGGTVELTGKVKLVSYTSCDDMLAGLREATAKKVTPWGLGGNIMYANRLDVAPNAKASGDSGGAGGDQSYSTTNVHEAGVDEPDLVKTDGKRIVTVNQGVLRVVDTATREVTGTLRLLPPEQSWSPADLLISGDRALVLIQGRGLLPFGAVAKMRPGLSDPKYMIVDLSGRPRVLGSLSVHGGHVDARQVGSVVRIVVRSQPEIAFPEAKPDTAESKLLKRNREAVMSAPIDAWLPRFTIESGGVSRTDKVKCEQVSHPAEFTGTSMLTVHTIDLAADPSTALDSDSPISVAADGDTVYGTQSSLYVTSNPRWWSNPMAIDDAVPEPGQAASGSPEPSPTPTAPPEQTEVHRFDIGGSGAPRYVGSGVVPGRLLNQYSLSEHQGNLRVATTSNAEVFGASQGTSDSGVYVLNADTLAQVGAVTGLGKGEQIYSVRFIGDLGYVVTFKQTDPLYTLDLRDPAAPKVTGELKISGYSSYLHPGGPGRLLGIGQEANAKGQVMGTQISLFDVNDPASPRILSRFLQKSSGSEAEWDPHAFLYWPESGLAMVPVSDWGDGGSGAIVLKVGDSGITKEGMITHPRSGGPERYDPGIRRCIVIGGSLWTVSDLGLKVSDAASLADQAWIPFK